MGKLSDDQQPSTSNKKNEENQKLVTLPKICLTRIDDKTLSNSNMPATPALKKPVKRLSGKIKKVQSLKKPSSSKNSPTENLVKRGRGRPKKDSESSLSNKSTNAINKIGSRVKRTIPKSLVRSPSKLQKMSAKISKKALLQKKSKIVIPVAKSKKVTDQKVKQSALPQKKQAPKSVTPKSVTPKPVTPKSVTPKPVPPKSITQIKQTPPKPKLKVLPTKQESSDTSEDDFLYDELIEELENKKNKQVGVQASASEKTTNITLKPNVGNKPPIIVKGGIVKRTDLPADLKSVASPEISVSIKSSHTEKMEKNTVVQTGKNNKRSSDSVKSPESAKKPSPWPVTISPQKKVENPNKNQKRPNLLMENSMITLEKTTKAHPKPTVSNLEPGAVDSVVSNVGLKQTAKVIPLSKSFEPDGNISDEYLEEERLDCDFESTGGSKKVKQVGKERAENVKSKVSGEDDPNIDLLRILTDDSDEPMPLETNAKKDVSIGLNASLESKEKVAEENCLTIEKSLQAASTNEATNQAEEEPAARTIYDLMNEVALQFPSWNLHIIPENSAFCIAQVTKGRLGLPTLKKCIELDPVHYNAKVYIHQYHIKRFDGVYDSEESILALIHEINNIKA